jgi:integrase
MQKAPIFRDKCAFTDSHSRCRFGKPRHAAAQPNDALRPLEYLTEAEVDRLRKAACAGNRNGHRDETIMLIAFRHGLRASELVALRWDAIDLDHGKLHCARRKNGTASVHPLTGAELRALRRVRQESPKSLFVFVCAVHRLRLSSDGHSARRQGWLHVPSSSAHAPPRVRCEVQDQPGPRRARFSRT